MDAFEYASPKTREDAVRLLADRPGKAAVLAGGTDLLSLMKDRIETPARLVSLQSIEDLRGIRRDSKGLRIGALTTLEDLLDDETIARDYPALHQAADGITSPQIRNMGTVGGDLCQRPRCWYYRNGFGLLALRDGTSMVPGGENRYHAVLGNSGPAYFVHASSLAPALIAFRARLVVFGGKGPREIRLESLFRIPSKEGEKEHTLAPDEILTEILLPPATSLKSATYEVRQKQALDWPLAAASVALEVAGGTLRSAHVVLGHVAPIPWRAPEAERVLEGATPGPDAAAKAGEAAVRGAKPLGRNAYKIRLARISVQRAILRALGGEV